MYNYLKIIKSGNDYLWWYVLLDMDLESSKKIDEIIFETNDKITAIVNEIRLIRFSKMDEKEKQIKYDKLRKEFEKVMHIEEKRVEEVMKNSSNLW